MSNINESKVTKGKTLLFNINQVSQNINPDDFQAVVSILDKELGSRKLAKEEIEQLQAIMTVDALEGAKWKKVSDVLKYISLFAIAENNPEATKKFSEVVLGIIGIFYPIANTAQGLLAKVPDKLFTILIRIGGLASPEYLLYRGASFIANQKVKNAKELAESEAAADEGISSLIVVCKDKFFSEEMNRLINLKDDLDDETVVGTKDGAVHTIIWNEAAWDAYRDRLDSRDRVLIIGRIKNTVQLGSDQIRFDKYGVKYGWNNNIAWIDADPKVLNADHDYNAFLTAINALQGSEEQKKSAKTKFDLITVGKRVLFPPLILGDILRKDVEVRKQQLLYGLYNLYIQDLTEFLKPEEA
ncbi:MAG: hypothetical protein E7444_08280 [Ruminococcaceae bacterium]|nr:hypothetical protein [Oscillospiraceae bacterium]